MSAPRVFDRALLRRRRSRARALGPATFLIDRVADDLADRLASVLRRFALVVDLGTPTDTVRRTLGSCVDTLIAVDPDVLALRDEDGLKVAADAEVLPFADAALDLVVSALAL